MTYPQNPLKSDADILLVLIKAIVDCLPDNKNCIELSVQKEVNRLNNSGVDHASAQRLKSMAVVAGLQVNL